MDNQYVLRAISEIDSIAGGRNGAIARYKAL